ncbi:glycosyltransferase [bacterium]|nr:glycosyltransferase [bacterium]
MNGIKTISIVTPSFNQGTYIEEAILSVLNQAGDFYIDYIIADGGSGDKSVRIIEKYDKLLKSNQFSVACKGITLKWWSEPDKGQTSALNRGFKQAKGEICAWINSDDYYKFGAFDYIIKKFRENKKVDLIYGNCFEVYDNGVIKKGEAIDGDFKKNLEQGCLISQPAAFFTKKALVATGYLDESFNYCMDYDLWLKIMKKGKALYVNKDLAYFRLWPKSKTGSQKEGFLKEEQRIRIKYGGSRFNPGKVHRFRQRIFIFNFLKKNFPKIYFFSKKQIYKLINLVKY